MHYSKRGCFKDILKNKLIFARYLSLQQLENQIINEGITSKQSKSPPVHTESTKTEKEGSSAESDSSGSSSATKINRNDLSKRSFARSFTRSTTSRSLMESQSLG